ncbi:MAG: hypothetical protein ABSE17_02470 [Candidatus Levyibacteriota bacterium]
MSQFEINFIHLCDAATIDGSGKLNMLGIFSIIYLQDIPGRLPKFTAVVSIGVEGKEGIKNTLEIKIAGPNNENLIVDPPIKAEFTTPNIPAKKKPTLNLILDIGNLEFKAIGKHTLNVFLNDKIIGSKSFNVEKREVK